jgi:hypothetical protein
MRTENAHAHRLSARSNLKLSSWAAPFGVGTGGLPSMFVFDGDFGLVWHEALPRHAIILTGSKKGPIRGSTRTACDSSEASATIGYASLVRTPKF